nr:MAG TPA: hypothetical protein [Caudoviricetes sp.]
MFITHCSFFCRVSFVYRFFFEFISSYFYI